MMDAIAACMGLPLVREYTSCKAKSEGLRYSETEGDEVEDLFRLLRKVKERFPEVESYSHHRLLIFPSSITHIPTID